MLLAATGESGFALAGSGAIREHGVIDRPTEDVDLFTTNIADDTFSRAVESGIEALTDAGYEVVLQRRAERFARLLVTAPDGSYTFDVDMGIDWRAHEPVTFGVGPVLALDDAVANKVGALYGRAEVRDFLDVDAIRQSGRFNDTELLASAAEHDPGFDRTMFAQRLGTVRRVVAADVVEYGVSAGHLAAVQERLLRWSVEIGDNSGLEFPRNV